MSLYHYVANKDELLALMVNVVLDGLDLPPGSGPDRWKESIRTGAVSFHDALRRHPWARGVMVSPKTVLPGQPGRLRFMEWLLKQLREGGFSPELTYHAYHALDSHIVGSTAWEAGYSSFKGDKKLANLAQDVLTSLPMEQLPFAGEHIQQHMAGFGRGTSQFEFGLDLILNGIERLRDSGETDPSAPSA
jgi:hypothetical protein